MDQRHRGRHPDRDDDEAPPHSTAFRNWLTHTQHFSPAKAHYCTLCKKGTQTDTGRCPLESMTWRKSGPRSSSRPRGHRYVRCGVSPHPSSGRTRGDEPKPDEPPDRLQRQRRIASTVYSRGGYRVPRARLAPARGRVPCISHSSHKSRAFLHAGSVRPSFQLGLSPSLRRLERSTGSLRKTARNMLNMSSSSRLSRAQNDLELCATNY